MDVYRKTVRRRMVLCSFLAVTALALAVYIFGMYGSEMEGGAGEGFITGFPCGICIGLFALCVFTVFRCMAMLRDEKKLRLGYNRDNDERMKLIRAKAGYPFSLVTAVAMIIVGLLLARVNMTVSLTAIACACGQLMVSVLFKLVYSKIL